MNHDNDTPEKKHGIAVVLSLLFTGAGHFYAEKEEKGTILLVVYIALGIFAAVSGGIGLIFLIPFWIWGMIDASGAVDEYNSRIKREANEKQEAKEAEEAAKQAEVEERAKTMIVTSEFVMQLEKISKLHIANFLTDEEYQSRKKDLILSLIEKTPQESTEDFFAALIPSVEKGYLNKEEVSRIKELLL